MTRILTLTLAALLPVAAFASGDDALDATTADQIRTRLTAEGYYVRKIEREDGMIEVYALKDGQKYELYLDAALNVVRSKIDD
ncbi:PepSY domain-containing protein [Aestuariicoccus sp. MJ-SS9]|uniref:PepSY domain-containing protein n=1 Tax=Aestuariicoccus sp. MJ-SS9 TaxID=3079855 RepID=UPI0029119A70|nr:PepSY domain-containing protein [Aestuariicoccus sp. MJ-SS9]MDU8912685.1 PepSY domain-containing protein [Aestuariicoccus sp. MJ-SS9]